MLAQAIHDDMCAGTTVEDITKNMQLIYSQLLDDRGQCNDEGIGTACLDDGLDDAVEIGLLVVVGGGFVQQFLDDVSELSGQRLAHLRARVFGADTLTDANQALKRGRIEGGEAVFGARNGCFGCCGGLHLVFDDLQLLLGVIDERAELADFFWREAVGVQLPDFTLDIARCVLKNMKERLVFAVYICHKMLCALGQVEYG